MVSYDLYFNNEQVLRANTAFYEPCGLPAYHFNNFNNNLMLKYE